jgi:hypothetical protein
MAVFIDGLPLTPQGKALNAKLLTTGQSLIINGVGLGDGTAIGNNALGNEVVRTSNITSRVVAPDIAMFRINFDSQSANIDHTWQLRELGVYAQDPDDGEILYAYGNAGSNYETIPAYGGGQFSSQTIDVAVQVADAANVTLNFHNSTLADNIGEPSIGAGPYAYQDPDTEKLMFKRFVAGDGVAITDNPETIEIMAKVENNPAVAGGVGLVEDPAGATTLVKRLVAGDGITVLDDTDTGSVLVKANILQADIDLFVPLDNPDCPDPSLAFETIQEAWDSLEFSQIPYGREARINVAAGRYNIAQNMVLEHPNGNRIKIIGAPVVDLGTVTPNSFGFDSPSGASNWLQQMAIADTSMLQVGDIVGFFGSGDVVWDGAHRVVAINSLTNIQLQQLSLRPSLPNNHSSPRLFWWPTQLKQATPAGTTLITVRGGGAKFENLAIQGADGTMDSGSVITFNGPPNSSVMHWCAISRGARSAISVIGSGTSLMVRAVFLGDTTHGIIIDSNASVDGGGTDPVFGINLGVIIGGCRQRAVWLIGGGAFKANGRLCACTAGILVDVAGYAYLMGATTGTPRVFIQNNNVGIQCVGGKINLASVQLSSNDQDINASAMGLVRGLTDVIFNTSSPANNQTGNMGAWVMV